MDQQKENEMIFEAGPSFDMPPAEAFVARCFCQIFLGTQEVAYSGDMSYRPLVPFGWETAGSA
jgi:hypothetical protein